MRHIYKVLAVVAILCGVWGTSCKKFDELNSDPNNLTTQGASPDYLMSNVLTQTAKWYGNLGSGDMSGAMQQTSQDAFGSTFSQYEWGTTNWNQNYAILRDNKILFEKGVENKWRFHKGVALIMRSFNMGAIADLWGDAPDSLAVNGEKEGAENQFPKFDSQEEIYNRVISNLKEAVTLLTGSTGDHPEITSVTESSDVYYHGDTEKWTKFAYSLMLRYYLRLSSKKNVQADVEAVASHVFASNDDDCLMPIPGKDANSSYQFCSVYNDASGFNRNKMCGTLTMKMKALKDPRIVIMAEPIGIPTVVDASKFAPGDNTTLLTIIGSVRYINPAAATASRFKQFDPATYSQDRPYGAIASQIFNMYDTSSVYVGIPISYSNNDFQYNINTSGTQSGSLNSYVSYLRKDIYDQPGGDLLVQKLASYTEICFDLAEAALKGWNVGGSAEDWYKKGVQASFDRWTVFDNYQDDVNNYYGCVKDFDSYIAQPAVAFNNTLERIIEQKWIASWQACNEAYMDWRRTGFPALTIGWSSYRGQIPLRFAYDNDELQNNPENSATPISKLEVTPYVGTDGNNSSWSRFWLVQGTGKPW